MADIVLNDEDILLPFTEETPVHADFMNPIIENVNKNTTRSKENASAIGQMVYKEAVRELKGVLSNMDLDTVFTPGLYHLNSTCINMPIAGNGFLQVTPHIKGGTTYILQEVTMWAISPYYMRRFQRVMLNGVWQQWDETATLKLTPVLATALPNITIVSQNSYILGKVLYIDIVVKRTDDSQFLNNTQYSVVTLSSLNITQPKNVGFTRWTTGFSGYIGGEIGGLYYDERIYIRPTTSCNLIHFMDSFILD